MIKPSDVNRRFQSAILLFMCIFLGIFIDGVAQDKTPTPQWRPVYHFSPKKTWTNDPNGLFYLNGTFHLYYQNNPFDNIWGHMSWGHAVSKDLVHWKYLPVAIPEVVTSDTTLSIFSGSAVIDSQNTSGFSQNGAIPVIAIFTGDLPKQKKEAQYIAYSNDMGRTFTLYQGNPVIDLDRADFRDPNVFWYAGTASWIMTVSLVHEHKIRLYSSKDLRHWSILSDFGPAGYTGHDWECPSLVSLPVKGNSPGTKWVLLVSCQSERGPYMQYFIGNFDGKTFHNDNPDTLRLTLDAGDCFYAAIPWRLPQNKQVLIGWLVPGKTGTNPWRGQMSIPRDLSLRYTDKVLRLFQEPSSIIRKNLPSLSQGDHHTWTHLVLGGAPVKLESKDQYNENAYWIEAEFDVMQAGKLGFNIAQDTVSGNKVVIGYDANRQILFIDCRNTKEKYKSHENEFLSTFLKPVNGKIKIQILFDKSSLEVFGNDGQKAITTMLYPTKNETGISVFSDGQAVINKLSIWKFGSTLASGISE